eukprot:2818737-Pyramimonas_sp.AAC.1
MASDRVHAESLLGALRRSGAPSEFWEMVGVMVEKRVCVVRGCDNQSAPRPQLSGTSQGCALSPL